METELHDAVKAQKLHEGAEVLEAKGEENVLLDVAVMRASRKTGSPGGPDLHPKGGPPEEYPSPL